MKSYHLKGTIGQIIDFRELASKMDIQTAKVVRFAISKGIEYIIDNNVTIDDIKEADAKLIYEESKRRQK